MKSPVRAFESAIVRLRDSTGASVGAGVLVGPHTIVTCTHVVQRASGGSAGNLMLPPESRLRVDFPLAVSNHEIEARLAAWHPPREDGGGDIACLEIVGNPPPGLQPTRLVDAPDLWQHPFRTLGFPPGHDDGVWASGRLLGRQAAGWIQLDDDRTSGFPVGTGFSGGPVWDNDLDGVVGIVVAVEGRAMLRTAYLIPTRTLVEVMPALAPHALPPSPYRGLASFREQDAGLFRGREGPARALTDLIHRTPVVAVVGPSGSGKSSLVFAGVLPELRRKQSHAIVSCRPAAGRSSFDALASAALPLLEPDLTESDRLAEVPKLAGVLAAGRLPEVIDRILAKGQAGELLLIVDQFEELFARGRDEARTFVDAILHAAATSADGPARKLRLLLTLRADYLSDALEHAGLAEAVSSSVFALGQMTRDQLRRVIEEPAAGLAAYEPGLVEQILSDVGAEPGNLPLLEFALTLLWERQEQSTLTHTAYDSIGGVAGALAGYAEQIYASISRDDQAAARRLLVQLVRPGDPLGPTRRIARREDFDDRHWAVAQSLVTTRLVVTGSSPDGQETVELAHEALIGTWERLRDWVETDRAFRTWQERLRGALGQWRASGKDRGALLRGPLLAEAEQWLVSRRSEISPTEQSFVRASHVGRRRVIRRLQVLTAGVAVLLLVAGIFSHQTWQLNRRAVSRALTDEAQRKAKTEPGLSALLSVAAYRLSDTPEARSALFERYMRYRDAERLLPDQPADIEHTAVSRNGKVMASADSRGDMLMWDLTLKDPVGARIGHVPDISSIALSSDGRALAIGNAIGEIGLWDVTRRVSLRSAIPAHRDAVSWLTFSPDGHTLASAGTHGDTESDVVMFWDVATGAEAFPMLQVSPERATRRLAQIEYGPDNETLVVTTAVKDVNDPLSHGTTVAVWDIPSKSAKLSRVSGQAATARPLWAVSSNGRRLAIVEEGIGSALDTVTLWELPDLQQIAHYSSPVTLDHSGFVTGSLTFDERGDLLVGTEGLISASLVSWNAKTGERIQTMHRPPPSRSGQGTVACTFDGRVLDTSDARNAILFRLQPTTALQSSSAGGWAALDPDDRHLATVSSNHGRYGRPDDAGVAQIASGPVSLWDLATGRLVAGPLLPPPDAGDREATGPMAFNKDGSMLATGVDGEDAVYLWDAHDNALRFRTKLTVGQLGAPGAGARPMSLGFLRDGTLLIGSSQAISHWDATRGRRIGDDMVVSSDEPNPATGNVPFIVDLSVRAGTEEIAVLLDNSTQVNLWDSRTRHVVRAMTGGHTERVVAVTFSFDGRMMASSDSDDQIIIWDPDQKNRILNRLSGGSNDVVFTPDSHELLAMSNQASSNDQHLSIWDLDQQREEMHARSIGDFSDVGITGVTQDGQTLVLALDGTPLAVPLDPSRWASRVCSFIGRDLTEQEWRTAGLLKWRRTVCP